MGWGLGGAQQEVGDEEVGAMCSQASERAGVKNKMHK